MPIRNDLRSNSTPLILNRAVEQELIESLYEMTSIELDTTQHLRYGHGRCSADMQLFDYKSRIIKIVSEDLINIVVEAVRSQVHVLLSFSIF